LVSNSSYGEGGGQESRNPEERGTGNLLEVGKERAESGSIKKYTTLRTF